MTYSTLASVSYYECRQGGCGKKFRVVKFHDNPDDDDLDQYFMEEVVGQDHHHDGVDIALRGLSKQQKAIVLQCDSRRLGAPKRVIEEFQRLAQIQIEANAPVVPTPTTSMISSFLSYRHMMDRGGIAVGSTTLQDLEVYSEANKFGERKLCLYFICQKYLF